LNSHYLKKRVMDALILIILEFKDRKVVLTVRRNLAKVCP